MKTIELMLTMILVMFFTGISAQEKVYKPNEDGVFYEAEVMPEFPGGFSALQDFLVKNIKYPEQAKKDSITGKVYVQFVIDETGRVGESKVIKSASSSLDNEALRVIGAMPAWTPGKVKGKAVKVAFTLPIMFALK